MPIIHILVTLIIVGFLLWLVNAVIPMDATIKQVVNAVVILLVILWVLQLFLPGLTGYRLGHP